MVIVISSASETESFMFLVSKMLLCPLNASFA
ncbi:hypothetical protein SAMN05192585_1151, partial [Acetanaerobacterium elongatum]